MSRLDYAPKLKEIEITDIKKGLGVFTPKPDKPVSFAALKSSLKKAGYTLDSAEITISGTLARDEKRWWMIADLTKQRFDLEGTTLDQVLSGAQPEARVEIAGDWKTVGEGTSAREVVSPRAMKKADDPTKTAIQSLRATDETQVSLFKPASFTHVSFEPAPLPSSSG